mmetsp:Transcript_23425/g.35988  ORF Transcript_23425/g.35988 Transcript_23425/m.35988 type:complete len:320 (-) Transcript_23425:131-1090(-)
MISLKWWLLASIQLSALFIQVAGNTHESQFPFASMAMTTCNNGGDCQQGQYCSRGVCRDYGTCSTRMDCVNPKNFYNTVTCPGRTKCDNGRCTKDCDIPICGNQPVAFCFDEPCDVQTCSEHHVDCVNSSCGGCKAIFFNDQGYRVCKPSDKVVEPSCEPSDCGSRPTKVKQCADGSRLPADRCEYDDVQQRCKWKFPKCPSFCSNDDECAESQYCGGGFCREGGFCRNRIDCLNPSNRYLAIRCEGYSDCRSNQCEQVCSSRRCPPGLREANCISPKCPRVNCRQEPVSCVNDSCGAVCKAIFFNAVGDQVCRRNKAS